MSEGPKLLEEMDDSPEDLQKLKDDLTDIGMKEPTLDELVRAGVDRNDAKLRTTKFFIEATSDEQFNLWQNHHEKEDWEQDNSGFM